MPSFSNESFAITCDQPNYAAPVTYDLWRGMPCDFVFTFARSEDITGYESIALELSELGSNEAGALLVRKTSTNPTGTSKTFSFVTADTSQVFEGSSKSFNLVLYALDDAGVKLYPIWLGVLRLQAHFATPLSSVAPTPVALYVKQRIVTLTLSSGSQVATLTGDDVLQTGEVVTSVVVQKNNEGLWFVGPNPTLPNVLEFSATSVASQTIYVTISKIS